MAGEGGASDKSARLTLDAIVARQYAERQAAAAKAASGGVDAPPRPASAAGAVGGKEAGGGKEGGKERTIFDLLFDCQWEERTTFPGAKPAAKAVLREVHSLVLALTMPSDDDKQPDSPTNKKEKEGPPSFLSAIGRCVCGESTTRAWCAEMGTHQRLSHNAGLATGSAPQSRLTARGTVCSSGWGEYLLLSMQGEARQGGGGREGATATDEHQAGTGGGRGGW